MRISAKKGLHVTLTLAVGFSMLAGCTSQKKEAADSRGAEGLTWESVQDSTNRLQAVEGFSGPEAVRYDPDQDLYFVSNFNGDGGEPDSNGFISKVSPGGYIDSLKYMTGTETHPLHAPRGMYITGDTLWAADKNGVHGFNRLNGQQIQFIDFSEFEPGFLNDIVQGPDGHLYVTDTGKSVLYVVNNETPSIIIDSLSAPPNGITLDASGEQLVLAPWGGERAFPVWNPADSTLSEYNKAGSGGNFDGIEFTGGRMLAASQMDSSLHVIETSKDHILIRLQGRPADIGLDTKRMQVAIPFVALNRVDIWALPEN